MEDAPAPNALNKFDVFEKDGEVFVKGQRGTIASSVRKPVTSCSVSGDSKVVIIGGLVLLTPKLLAIYYPRLTSYVLSFGAVVAAPLERWSALGNKVTRGISQ